MLLRIHQRKHPFFQPLTPAAPIHKYIAFSTMRVEIAIEINIPALQRLPQHLAVTPPPLTILVAWISGNTL